MNLHWHYKRTEPFFPQGKDTTRPNFSREERSEIGILIREALQNPLDIRRDDCTGAVRVVLQHLGPGDFDTTYLDSIFTDEFRKRLQTASGIDLPAASDASVLVIEDFGTKGLVGAVDNYDADGQDQNWNAFWHREGEGAKGKASNGGAGQGKITYFAHSTASTVLGLTVRSTDSERLLMGRSGFLRDYQFNDGHKYYRAAYWTTSDKEPTPESNPDELDRFSKAFKLSRDSVSSGLSLVIPFAKAFEPQEAVKSVILDFYMPIAAGRLEVLVGDVKISSKTIDKIADRFISDEDVVAASSSFTKGYRTFARSVLADPATHLTLNAKWNKNRTIPEDAFPTSELAKLQGLLESGARIAVSLPLTLKLKGGQVIDTSFDVFIEAPSDLDHNQEAFVRRDLLIGAESHVTAGALVQRTRSLTWIQNRELSDFLLSAEEPTHLKWNASLARDKAEYRSPEVALRSIRQAVPRLLAVLLGGNTKKDFKSLARFFSKPAASMSKKSETDGHNKRKGKSTPPPPPTPRPFRIESKGPMIQVIPNGMKTLQDSQLPVQAVLELAYEGLDQDPFAAYDPFDFDIAQTDLHPITSTGISVTSRAYNRIEMEVMDRDFKLEIGGFDPNVRLRARLNFELNDESRDDGSADASQLEEAADV